MTFRPVPRAPNATFSEYICQGIRLTVFTKDALPVGDAVTVFRMKTLAKGLGDLGLKTLGHEKRGIQVRWWMRLFKALCSDERFYLVFAAGADAPFC